MKLSAVAYKIILWQKNPGITLLPPLSIRPGALAAQGVARGRGARTGIAWLWKPAGLCLPAHGMMLSPIR